MPVAFPTELNDKILTDSYKRAIIDTRVSDDSDLGIHTSRQTMTGTLHRFTVKLGGLTLEQENRLRAFYETDVQQVNTFTIDLLDKAAGSTVVQVAFDNGTPLDTVPKAGNFLWDATLNLIEV